MTTPKLTIGQAIDQLLAALTPLEKREQQTVISTVCSFLALDSHASSASGTNSATLPQPDHSSIASSSSEKSRSPTHMRHGVDIRTLKEEKQPDSARQMACIVAYYLSELSPEDERKQTITTADIERYFKQANYKLPTKLEQLLIDCKGSGYFEAVARGEYKLTRVGYNLVTHSMPKSSKAQ